ncbi:hypothetical protein C8E03_1134 [Lachnotalea glycerini]|uniref:Uncharacterized protein n=1 Tax=Lachnotalea glycerini TaxID=1763509 RepID=A0A318EMQ7_9FIRM|nr:hypothetical protein C8E03_1134 [Lachnotalea glycerini]
MIIIKTILVAIICIICVISIDLLLQNIFKGKKNFCNNENFRVLISYIIGLLIFLFLIKICFNIF